MFLRRRPVGIDALEGAADDRRADHAERERDDEPTLSAPGPARRSNLATHSVENYSVFGSTAMPRLALN